MTQHKEFEQRGDHLLELIRHGLDQASRKQTRAMLGKRVEYLGLSDIGHYADCPRAAVFAKLFPSTPDLNRLLTLERGHWFENGIASALSGAGMRYLPQLEIAIRHESVPIQAHLDFTLTWDRPRQAVRILEVKSVNRLPDEPYTSHRVQAQGQVSLLYKFWGEPVFSLRRNSGRILHRNLTFPQICEKMLGIDLPNRPAGVSIECWLLYLSMQEARTFGPIVHSREGLTEIFDRAHAMWQDFEGAQDNPLAVNSIPHVRGFHPLCSRCEANADCPKFQDGDFQPQWEEALHKLDGLKRQKTSLETEATEIEDALRQAHRLSHTDGWINTGQHRFRLTSTPGRRSLNRDALREELDSIFRLERLDIDVDALLTRNEREGSASSRLSISPVKSKEA